VGYPITVFESSGANVRGHLPGLYCPLHNNPLNHGDILDNVVGISRRIMLIGISEGPFSGRKVGVDIDGPWR